MVERDEAEPARLARGQEYDAQLTRRRSDRRTRAAFQRLVLGIAVPGTRVLDFGAGTGLDACRYAQRGLEVAAYEPDPAMCDAFVMRCRQWLDCGRVALERGPYREFLARSPAAAPKVELVTANFAPFNLVTDLRELFACLHARTAPDARILASVLNPYYLGDLRYRWWWRNLGQLLRAGCYAVPGAEGPIVRRGLELYAAECEPGFRLRGVAPGRLRRDVPAERCTPPPLVARRAGPPLAAGRYLFLLFERRGMLTSAVGRGAQAAS